MEKQHPLNDLMSVAADKLRALADSNTVVGQPIQAGDVTLIPVSRLSFGIASGGTEYSTKSRPWEATTPSAAAPEPAARLTRWRFSSCGVTASSCCL